MLNLFLVNLRSVYMVTFLFMVEHVTVSGLFSYMYATVLVC
jgi:hypothetical protein